MCFITFALILVSFRTVDLQMYMNRVPEQIYLGQ